MYKLVTDTSLRDSILESCGLLVYGIGGTPIYVTPPSEGKVAQYEGKNYLIFQKTNGDVLVINIPQNIFDPIKAQEAYTSGPGVGTYLGGFWEGAKTSFNNLTSGSKTIVYVTIILLVLILAIQWTRK